MMIFYYRMYHIADGTTSVGHVTYEDEWDYHEARSDFFAELNIWNSSDFGITQYVWMPVANTEEGNNVLHNQPVAGVFETVDALH